MLGKARFTIGFIVGSIVFGSSAFAATTILATNTPEGGYLLCFNSKTKAVTYPGKLICPTGTKALDLGAGWGEDGADGLQGQQGPQGPQGPQGIQGIPGLQGVRGDTGPKGLTGDTGPRGLTGATGAQGPAGSGGTSIQQNYWKVIPERDIVVDGTVTDFAKAKTVVMATISTKNLPLGYFSLEANLSGLWSTTVFDLSSKPMVRCYFQDKEDYDSKSGSRQYGVAKADYVDWNSLSLTVKGYAWFTALTDDPVYLVCSTTGTLQDFDGQITAVQFKTTSEMTGEIGGIVAGGGV
jgi:hypothetical protein